MAGEGYYLIIDSQEIVLSLVAFIVTSRFSASVLLSNAV